MNEQPIRTIIDKHLKKWIDLGLNKVPIEVESEMADPNQDKNEEWRIWFPIESKITNRSVQEFESIIGHKLPTDYCIFLRFKHFYTLHISEAKFCPHPIGNWREKQLEMIFEVATKKYLVEKGYVPFADWSDWGLLCFDTNKNNGGNNYPVVLWDHEIADAVQDKYKDFYEMLELLDKDDSRKIV